MLHQREKERHVAGRDPLLVQRENVVAAAGVDEEIRILHALRDALVGQQLPQLVAGKKSGQFFRRDVGINGHGGNLYSTAAFSRKPRGSGKNTSSSAADTVSTLTV